VILNAYAVIDAFLTMLRGGFGLFVIGLVVVTWRRCGWSVAAEQRKLCEDRNYLLSQLTLLVLALNLISWPLLYALLQSYVIEWPGVMCVYGVTRIGAGSVGVSRFLPGLLLALQTLKPLLVFASGAWFVLYLLNRRTQTGPLLGTLLPALLLCGLLTVVDAGAELTYLLLPKKEERQESGCCAGAFEDKTGPMGTLRGAGTPAARPWLYGAFYVSNGLMALALFGLTRQRPQPVAPGPWLAPLLGGAGLALGAAALFLIEVVAPTVLHLPYHHCPYDLIPGAPDVLVGVAFLLWGACSIGWACVLAWFGRCRETAPFLADSVRGLLFMAFCCYLGSLVLLSLELALA
jgi:hypothetical protein